MRRLTLLIVLMVLFMPPLAKAEDNIFTSTAVLKEQVSRLGNEGLEVIATPVDVRNYGLISTLAVAGGVGITYLFDDDIRKKVQGTKGNTLDKAADAGEIIGNPFVHLGIAGAFYGGGLLADSPKWREMGEMLGEVSA